MDELYLIEKKQNDFENGKTRQEVFIELMILNGYRCYRAQPTQDAIEHWDVITVKDLENGDKVFDYIDVKGEKYGMRHGYACAELQTIYGGKGWLHAKIMNTLVLETEDSFWFINREKFESLVMENVEKIDAIEGRIVYLDWDIKFEDLGFYRRYKRISHNNDDEVVKVSIDDFKHLVHTKLYKENAKLEFIND
jgi:hypothetical protein